MGNAYQAASYYTTRMGFEYVAYQVRLIIRNHCQGLETQSRDYCTHVVRNGDIVYAFTSALNPDNQEFTEQLGKHGDGVRDVAFTVDDATGIYQYAVSRGATSVAEPKEYRDEHGSVIMASVRTYGDTIHTFVQRVDYTGPFLPGYAVHHMRECLN